MYKCVNGWTKENMKEQIKLKNNGTRAFNSELNSCLYRNKNDNNNACVVGCFIPDDHVCLTNDFLGGYRNLISVYDVEHYMPLERDAMILLQTIHDMPYKDNSIYEKLFAWIDRNVED